MARFVNAQVPEVVQPFWAVLQRGESIADAAVQVGTYRKQGTRWVAACGGLRPRRGRNLKGRCLAFAEREEIALARASGETMRAIARRLGRSPSTISRELERNADRDGGYRATFAHGRAHERASRPKPAKLATNQRLRAIVQDDLARRLSPGQIAGGCAAGSPTTRRCGCPRRRANARPQGANAARGAAALTGLGPGEMRDSKQVRVDTGIEVFFCDPHAPWQRGSNENTNGPLRPYFPKGTDFSTVTRAQLDAVADELNQRPRKRLAFANPTEQLAELLLQ
jgi:IS30 family transposase